MNPNIRYFALVFELPVTMLVLGYFFKLLDESYDFGGYGLVLGIVLALVLWIVRASMMLNRSNDDT